MSPQSQIAKTYVPAEHESRMYELWEKAGYFKGTIDKTKEPFAIAMPPPNATGSLHLGHVVPETVEDILTRFERMRGKATLFLPGTDHAAIATNALVEKKIAEEEGKTRHDLGREEFLKRVKAFVAESQDNIRDQIRRIGVSCDWSRERYTMDEQMTRAVNEAFVRMHREGLIYRGKRIISWCPRCSSALSDIEVDYQEVDGNLWYIKYPIVKAGRWSLENSVMIATTRPETMLGDTAIAVNPTDKRYKDLVGKNVLLPLVEREIPVVADKHVDQSFGTGALKITPAHDMADYEIGEAHNLEAINVIGESGRMTKHAHDFSGMEIQQARDEIVLRLQKLGFLDHIEEHKHKVPICSRCDAKVEPLISKQWFVKVAPLAKEAIEAVKSGQIEFIPKRFEKIYFQWMENIYDWNISRQLWWGHRIPVWTCESCAHVIVSADPVKECPKCQNKKLKQDPDTLDTWFSSGLWTFATLGWPEKTAELDYWHPTSVMETGRDILFFWVARMIMLSLFLQKEVPFKKIYLNGLVLDKHGKKMSKSKGNVIDPLAMADKYGMDAVRMSVILGVSAGQDNRLNEEKIAGYRNFANKLWNVARFVITTTECKRECPNLAEIKMADLELEDRWILHRLNELTAEVTAALEKFKFSEAGQAMFHFLWDEFADWYIEITKLRKTPIKNDLLILILEDVLKLVHPYMPFVTETIWQEFRQAEHEQSELKQPEQPDLIVAPWPQAVSQLSDPKSAKEFAGLQDLIIGLRNIRADFRISTSVIFKVASGGVDMIEQNKEIIEKLARVKVVDQLAAKKVFSRTLAGQAIKSDVAEHIDTGAELARTEKELAKTEKVLQALAGRLKNERFLEKAPPEVVEEEKTRQATLTKKVADLKNIAQELKKLSK